ncbi:prostaglandin-H2 D-isomerase-like [Arapaima gigas]
MKLALVLFPLTVIHVYCVSPDVKPQDDFDVQKFAGKWYRVAVAYNSPTFASYKDKIRMSVMLLTPQENGDVNATIWKQKSSGCRNKTLTYKTTAVPGKFTYFSSYHQKAKEIIVAETDYNEYAVVVKYKVSTKEFPHLSLYGRAEKPRPELMEKFKEFSLSQGLPKELVLVLPPAQDCLPDSV